ncbi:MAG: hypothetical protein LBE08_01295 [Bifidobacteriaceae bacterium]|jgi:hypothetical protein|nr:hypothetical protein [Bifidobacteriaceae bacterium]
MRGLIARLRARSGRSGDAGMTVAELLAVIAVGGMVMGMVTMVTVSMLKHDAKNLIRQNRSDGIRQVSVWLGDALSHASSEKPASATGGKSAAQIFTVAAADHMEFTSALPVAGDSGGGHISRVEILLGDKCWGGGPDPGVLHRCLQSPKIVADVASFCAKGTADCPDDLFEDLVVARDVEEGELFTYYVRDPSTGDFEPATHSVPDTSLARIGAVEMRVTVAGPTAGPNSDEDLQATVFKRFTIREWENL